MQRTNIGKHILMTFCSDIESTLIVFRCGCFCIRRYQKMNE